MIGEIGYVVLNLRGSKANTVSIENQTILFAKIGFDTTDNEPRQVCFMIWDREP